MLPHRDGSSTFAETGARTGWPPARRSRHESGEGTVATESRCGRDCCSARSGGRPRIGSRVLGAHHRLRVAKRRRGTSYAGWVGPSCRPEHGYVVEGVSGALPLRGGSGGRVSAPLASARTDHSPFGHAQESGAVVGLRARVGGGGAAPALTRGQPSTRGAFRPMEGGGR